MLPVVVRVRISRPTLDKKHESLYTIDMRILFCGDRLWEEEELIRLVLEGYDPETTIIVHGNAPGADRIAARLAYNMGFKVEPHSAKWERYGKAAGPIRNKEMLDSGIDFVEAFHNNIENSRGTKDMVKIALKADIPVAIHHSW